MEKYRLSTTVSKKHHDILKKHIENHKTQQKVLELALESLENNSNSHQSSAMTPEEKLKMELTRELKNVCTFSRDGLKDLFECCDIERLLKCIADKKWLEFSVEFQYHKHFKECSLKEIMDGVINSARMVNWFDSINYSDDGDHYTMAAYHSLGLNGTKFNKAFLEGAFKSYGVKTESESSERSIFIKIFKRL